MVPEGHQIPESLSQPLVRMEKQVLDFQARVESSTESLSTLYFLKNFVLKLSPSQKTSLGHPKIREYLRKLMLRVDPKVLNHDQKSMFNMVKVSLGFTLDFPKEIKQPPKEKTFPLTIIKIFVYGVLFVAFVGVIGVFLDEKNNDFFVGNYQKLRGTFQEKGLWVLFLCLLLFFSEVG